MNHDYAHCLDYSPDCPKECFRARLTKDLKGRIDLGGLPLTWMHFKGTYECRKEVTEQNKHKAKIVIDALRMAKTIIEAEGETDGR